MELKRKILTQNIYGVDLDAAAVEVPQLSLYLKMLEHENRTTLQRQRELLADETDIALLPPLQDNIKCGNSLNRPGNRGRNNLYMYMRHWTAGWLKRELSALYKELTWSYAQGMPLAPHRPGVRRTIPTRGNG